MADQQVSIKKAFDLLKINALGTKSSQIDKAIDNSLQSIETYSSKIGRNKYLETIKSLVRNAGVDNPDTVLKDLQNNFNIETYDHTGRIRRYQEYDAILNRISYCQRALKVLTDNIISPDEITKQTIRVMSVDEDDQSETTKTTISRIKKIIRYTKFEKYTDKLISCTLKKGDYFAEIIYSPRGENILTVVNENKHILLNDITKMDAIEAKFTVKHENADIPIDNNIVVEFGNFGGALTGIAPTFSGAHVSKSGNITTYKKNNYGEPKSKDKHPTANVNDDDEDQEDPRFQSKFKEEEGHVDIRDLFITLHDPKYVIRLETERFRTCLGFLVFPKVDPNMIPSGMMASSTNSVDEICMKIIDRIEKSLQMGNDKIVQNDDLKELILKYLLTIKNNEDLVVRYVPPEMMVHWRINVDRFHPYGESIFECVNFDCRMLVALKTAMTIKRLTSSTDKRIVSVETGLPRDAKNLIESVKEGMRKRKISIDSMGSIDTIPSQIQTFEDIYIPMRDGKKFIEFDHQQFGPNPQEDVEGLKFIRDNIVANLGVPPPFLGLEENTSNRALLTVENINFCRTIISYQKEISEFLLELFEKFYIILWPGDRDDTENIKITFQEPKISPYEHEMEFVEQMQRLIEAYKALGIPDEYLKKKYMPFIDWSVIDKYTVEDNIKKASGETPTEEDNSMGIGGMGGYGSGYGV